VPEREFGWVTEAADAYVRPVVRITVRCRKSDGKFAYGVLLSTLSAQQVLALTGQPLSLLDEPAAVLLAYVTDLAISVVAASKRLSRATSKNWA
jgi:hypothetical protein